MQIKLSVLDRSLESLKFVKLFLLHLKVCKFKTKLRLDVAELQFSRHTKLLTSLMPHVYVPTYNY